MTQERWSRGKRLDVSGTRFGRLVALYIDSEPPRVPGTYWVCECDCGAMRSVLIATLRRGHVRSCGCLYGERHGLSKTVEFRIWANMRARCENPRNKAFHRYGGRGIAVVQRWERFSNFLADMGERPSTKHSIDRIDNDGPYAPWNCRWATQREQTSNTSRTRWVTYEGEPVAAKVLARRLGVNYRTFYMRVKRNGWSYDRYLETEAQCPGS